MLELHTLVQPFKIVLPIIFLKGRPWLAWNRSKDQLILGNCVGERIVVVMNDIGTKSSYIKEFMHELFSTTKNCNRTSIHL